jgi:Spy/CpxP family protein refolding chaperone
MLTTKTTRFFIMFITAIFLAAVPIHAAMDINLTPDQIKALEGVVNDLGAKQLKITGDIERTLLELKLEIQRADRFATDAKAKESARRANKLIKKLAALRGDMLKVEVSYILKAKDVLTRDQRMQLIQGLDFEMESPQGWMESQQLEVLVVDLGLSDDQMKKIMDYRAQMQKKAVKIAKKMEAHLQSLETELQKDTPDDKKVNQAVMGLIDQGIALLNNHVDHRLKAKDVLTVAQKKQLLHALFIASGF